MEAAMLTTTLLLLCIACANAFMFIRECVDSRGPDGTFPVPCCPLYNGSPCGESFGRGTCVLVKKTRSGDVQDRHIDERYGFPQAFYSTICQCAGNYDGPMCAECKHGYMGDDCSIPYSVLRKEIRQMSLLEWRNFKAALNYCKVVIDPYYYLMKALDRLSSESYVFITASYYDVWCYNHFYATLPFINNTRENNIINYAHYSTGFLSFHRYLLLKLENQLHRCMNDPDIAIPYLDWSQDIGNELFTDEYFGSVGSNGRITENSVFSTWHLTCGGYQYPQTACLMEDCRCQNPGIERQIFDLNVPLSTRADINYCLSIDVLDTAPFTWGVTSFRNCLEGNINRYGQSATTNHNAFHMVVGGTMSQVPISCNDPCFMFHHSFIEKIFCIYSEKIQITPDDYPPDNHIYGHGANDCITPYTSCVKQKEMFVSCASLGVQYTSYRDL
ncbi:tyrosinase-like [Pseudophryne corroboree]|uniref:tyrosinase-like n=1 Tax=Pseudophryne corroboree TaxID=495146 RepID=UPI003081B6DB